MIGIGFFAICYLTLMSLHRSPPYRMQYLRLLPLAHPSDPSGSQHTHWSSPLRHNKNAQEREGGEHARVTCLMSRSLPRATDFVPVASTVASTVILTVTLAPTGTSLYFQHLARLRQTAPCKRGMPFLLGGESVRLAVFSLDFYFAPSRTLEVVSR